MIAIKLKKREPDPLDIILTNIMSRSRKIPAGRDHDGELAELIFLLAHTLQATRYELKALQEVPKSEVKVVPCMGESGP